MPSPFAHVGNPFLAVPQAYWLKYGGVDYGSHSSALGGANPNPPPGA